MKSLKILWVFLWFPLCAVGQDVYEIKFTADDTQYRAALILFANRSSMMRVKFNDGGTEVVEQSVTVDSTKSGVRIKGSNPVYPGTSIKFPSYDANNFYLTQNPDSTYTIKNLDDNGTSKGPTIRKIEGDVEVNYFLFYFNWKLKPE